MKIVLGAMRLTNLYPTSALLDKGEMVLAADSFDAPSPPIIKEENAFIIIASLPTRAVGPKIEKLNMSNYYLRR